MSLSTILENALSADPQFRDQAYNLLQQQKESNPGALLEELSQILSSPGLPAVRQLSGITIKNLVSNSTKEDCLVNLWASLAPASKQSIRSNILGTLADASVIIQRSAAQAVATVAKHDFAQKEWLDLIDILIINANNTGQSFRMASLMTLGYICEDLDPAILTAEQVNSCLSAIAAGVHDPDPELKIVSLRALQYSLNFAQNNFKVDNERTLIIQMIGGNCLHAEQNVRLEAFMALCELAHKYYDYLHQIITEIVDLTFKTINSDTEKVAILAVDVWNIIGDTELARVEHPHHAKPNRGYIASAAEKLIELMLVHISRVEEEEDDWTISKACGSTLIVCMQLTKDRYLELPVKYIRNCFQSSELKAQRAGCLIFGCILEGPSAGKLYSVITGNLEYLTTCLAANHRVIREAAAWALAKVCEVHYRIVAQPQYFQSMIQVLCSMLNCEPSTACHSCWAVINLIEHSSEVSLFKLNVFQPVITALFSAAQRPDAISAKHNLEQAAYSAMATLIEKSAEDCQSQILGSIEQFITLLGSAQSENTQNSLCSVLQATFSRASSSDISDSVAVRFMEIVMAMFSKSPTEEGLQAIGALAGCIEERISHFLKPLGPYLAYALQNTSTVPLCKAGIMLIGDIARALKDESVGIVDDLVRPLIDILVKGDVDGELKVQSIESLADIATYSKGAFNKFVPEAMGIIQSASQITLQEAKKEDDPDLWEYLKNLREAIVQFYEGFVQGQTACGQFEELFPFVQGIIEYVNVVSNVKFAPSHSVIVACIGIIGDLATAYKQQVRDLLRVQKILQFLQINRTSNNMKVREIANWSFNCVNAI